MSNFQIIVLGICSTLLLVGIGVFAAFGGLLGNKGVGEVVVWGTVSADVMQNLIETLRTNDKTFDDVSYYELTPAKYSAELLNAMASGRSPDLFLVSTGELLSFSDKITPLPYNQFSQASYLTSYIDEGQIFLTPQGILALPFSVDPLVMYWNRDLFASAGLASPPEFWNDFLSLAPKITSLGAGSVRQSAVALGEWRNVVHAKEILSALFMQAGDSIVVRGSDGIITSVFGTTPANFPANPAESALRFYTEFANPSKTSYSWNRALPRSTEAFLAGDLAVYFGFASENEDLEARNSALRYGVALLPQIEGNPIHVTYGAMTGVAISRSARNPAGAAVIAQKLTSKIAAQALAAATKLPSARRDTGVNTAQDATAKTFFDSALISRAWLDPNQTTTNTLFQTMIESVVSGKKQPGEAVSAAAQEFYQLLRR